MKTGRPNKTGINWRSGDHSEKTKMREYQKSYKEKHRDKYAIIQKTSELKTRYGLSYERYEEMLKEQEGKCATCGKTELLCVDHDHETNEVRGLLCQKCNIAIGLLMEDKTTINKILEYLK